MHIDTTIRALDGAKKETTKGGQYWMARNIQTILGYSTWEYFKNAIKRAIMACESTGVEPLNHFRETTKMVEIGSGARRSEKDFFLTRYACYLIAMNGDSSKPEIATAQSYFAIQTRMQEQFEKLSDNNKRLILRERVKDANKHLSAAAKMAGVQKYALFHDAGYRGLYEMDLSEIKQRKGIGVKENPLDRMGRTELAANEFRITQTEDALIRDKIKGDMPARKTHNRIGRKVRQTIRELGGTMPENLSAEQSIKKISSTKQSKRLSKTKTSK